MTGDVLMAAATIVRERVRRSVFGVVGILWLAGTLMLVVPIVPISVERPNDTTIEVYWAKWELGKQDSSEFPAERPPDRVYPENLPWPPPPVNEELARGISNLIAEWALALAGMAFIVMVTCDFFTGATERGRVELLLSRPMPRSVVVLSHYAAGVLFAGTLFATTIGLTFLAIWFRTGAAPVGYLLTLPILIGFYAVLHAIQTLAAAAWRSWFLALLIPVVVWAAAFGVQKARAFVKPIAEGHDAAAEAAGKAGGPNAVEKVQAAPMVSLIRQGELPLDVAYHVLPKLSEFDNLNYWAIYGRDRLKGEVGEDYSPWITILSSAAWMVVCLVLACVRFHFREF